MVKKIGDIQKYVKNKYKLQLVVDDIVLFDKNYNRLKDIVPDVPFSYDTLKNINRGTFTYKKKYKNYRLTKLTPTVIPRTERPPVIRTIPTQ